MGSVVSSYGSETLCQAACVCLHSLTLPPLVPYHWTRLPNLINVPIRLRTSGSGYSPLNDPSPNWSNRPPKETILLDGCDYEHWLIVMEYTSDPKPTEEEMIDSYVRTLASVVGSEDEANKKIYSICTTTYTEFGALISKELSYKVKGLPGVLWVLPDSYLDVPNKDYGGHNIGSLRGRIQGLGLGLAHATIDVARRCQFKGERPLTQIQRATRLQGMSTPVSFVMVFISFGSWVLIFMVVYSIFYSIK